jgi:hypothetical protein
MKVTTKINQSAVQSLSKAQRQALEMTGQQLLNDLRDEQTMPFDTGNLQNDSTYMDDSKSAQGQVSVVSDTPYARRLYFHPEINFQKGKNPNAGAEWFEPYIHGNKAKKVKEWFKQFIKRNGGGYIK